MGELLSKHEFQRRFYKYSGHKEQDRQPEPQRTLSCKNTKTFRQFSVNRSEFVNFIERVRVKVAIEIYNYLQI